jgi:hypothetical protein
MFGVGDKAPDFTLNTADGEPITLSEVLPDGRAIPFCAYNNLGIFSIIRGAVGVRAAAPPSHPHLPLLVEKKLI